MGLFDRRPTHNSDYFGPPMPNNSMVSMTETGKMALSSMEVEGMEYKILADLDGHSAIPQSTLERATGIPGDILSRQLGVMQRKGYVTVR